MPKPIQINAQDELIGQRRIEMIETIYGLFELQNIYDTKTRVFVFVGEHPDKEGAEDWAKNCAEGGGTYCIIPMYRKKNS